MECNVPNEATRTMLGVVRRAVTQFGSSIGDDGTTHDVSQPKATTYR